jgi:hypothetical protein
MGSVIPFTLGLSITKPTLRLNAIEGDGSLVMNLGCLLTFKRYGRHNIRVFLLDNRCYESTGGQQNQPNDFAFEQLIRSIGLDCSVVNAKRSWKPLYLDSASPPTIRVVKIERSIPAARVPIKPPDLPRAFVEGLIADRQTC